jgi:hypothetical protein
VSILILLVVKNKKGTEYIETITYGDWKSSQTDLFQNTYASGSGASDYLSEISADDFISGNFDFEDLNDNLEERAKTANLCLVAQLLGKERFTLNTIKRLWGGGFEIIYYDGAGFRKFDKMTYLVWHAKVNDQEELIPNISLILHCEYCENVLYIRSFSGGEKLLYKIPTIDSQDKPALDELPMQDSFDSNTIAHCYVVEMENRNAIAIPTVTENNGFKISYRNGKLEIEINEEIEYDIMEYAKSKMRDI